MFATEIPVDVGQIGLWVVILGVVLGIYMKLRKWEGNVRGEGEKREVGPLPLPVAMAKEFTTRDSFHKHAELNRQAHEHFQKQIEAIKDKMAIDKEEIIEAGNERSEKIQNRISTAFEEISGNIGELRGELNVRRRAAR